MSSKKKTEEVVINNKKLVTGQLIRYKYVTKIGVEHWTCGVFYRKTKKGKYMFFDFNKTFPKRKNVTDIEYVEDKLPKLFHGYMGDLCKAVKEMKVVHDQFDKKHSAEPFNRKEEEYKERILDLSYGIDGLCAVYDMQQRGEL